MSAKLQAIRIPFSPPFIDEDVKQEVLSALESGWITTGPKVKALEEEVANYCNVEYALGISSATAGMQLMMHWLGVKKDDEVIVPAYTYCATALAAMHEHAVIKMADVGEDFNISISSIKAAITPKTKAIILVDFAGWPCDYDEVFKLVTSPKIKTQFNSENEVQHQLGRIFIMADAAHSFGAVYKHKKVGTLADATVFSFHAVKNLTTAEGGMICFNLPEPFNNNEIYKTLRLWSLNGQTKDAFSKSVAGGWKYDIIYPGFKMNLPDVLAAIGLSQFRKYKSNLLAERKRVFITYNVDFEQYDWAICPPYNKPGFESSYHLYPLRIKNATETQRDEIIKRIAEKGVAVNVHFIPLPMLTIFKNAGYCIEDYPNSYALYANEISLPVYPQLNAVACAYVIACVVEAINEILYEEG